LLCYFIIVFFYAKFEVLRMGQMFAFRVVYVMLEHKIAIYKMAWEAQTIKEKLLAAAIDDLFRFHNTCGLLGNSPFVFT